MAYLLSGPTNLVRGPPGAQESRPKIEGKKGPKRARNAERRRERIGVVAPLFRGVRYWCASSYYSQKSKCTYIVGLELVGVVLDESTDRRHADT